LVQSKELVMVEGLVLLLAGYAGIGLLFAVAFVVLGVHQIDPAAAEGTRGFKMLILPGVAALWPWLLLRWVRKSSPPTEKTAHRQRSQVADGEAGVTQ